MKFIKMPVFCKRGCQGFVILFLFAAYTLSSSCMSTKKVVYFRDLPDTMNTPVVMSHVTPFVAPTIENNDILAITVQPLLQNTTMSSSSPLVASNGNTATANTFLVDKNGYIEYSLIGRVKVGGLTTTEAKDLLTERAKTYYKDPVVSVRITNFDILILGDIAKPGSFNSPSEKVTIIDVIAQGGDLNISAKRDNILLVRSIGDQKEFSRYDISSSKIFQSPNYYLKQRDIIYVEPNKYKVQSSDQTFIRNLGILSSLISLASLVLVFRSIK
jgi:polysaccharide export outer membrane protein